MPQSLASYGDVAPVWETAIDRPDGLRYRLPTWGKAVNFRQRCYRYRKTQQRLMAERQGPTPGIGISTAFDTMVITIEDPRGIVHVKTPEAPASYQFFDVVFRHREIDGELLDMMGTPIEAKPREADDLDLDLE